MSWAGALDRAIKVVRDTFPATGTYTPEGGSTTYTLTGVFDEAYKGTVIDTNMGLPVETTHPVWTIVLADLPVAPRVNAAVVVNGTSYTVSDVQVDGSGMARLYLVEVV